MVQFETGPSAARSVVPSVMTVAVSDAIWPLMLFETEPATVM